MRGVNVHNEVDDISDARCGTCVAGDTDGFETILENTDRVFVVRERNGAWMDNYT
jgi:hypothetical protein